MDIDEQMKRKYPNPYEVEVFEEDIKHLDNIQLIAVKQMYVSLVDMASGVSLNSGDATNLLNALDELDCIIKRSR